MEKVDEYIKFLNKFSSQKKHYIGLYDSADKKYDLYLHVGNEIKWTLGGDEWSRATIGGLDDLIKFMTKYDIREEALVNQLESRVSAKIAYSHTILDSAADTFGAEYVTESINAWDSFANQIRNVVSKLTKKNTLKLL